MLVVLHLNQATPHNVDGKQVYGLGGHSLRFTDRWHQPKLLRNIFAQQFWCSPVRLGVQIYQQALERNKNTTTVRASHLLRHMEMIVPDIGPNTVAVDTASLH